MQLLNEHYQQGFIACFVAKYYEIITRTTEDNHYMISRGTVVCWSAMPYLQGISKIFMLIVC